MEAGVHTVSSKMYEEIRNFILQIISQYEISQSTTQVGYVAFSNFASVDHSSNYGFSVGQFSSQASLTAAVGSLTRLPQPGRRTDLGLNLAVDQLTNRLNFPNSVIVIETDISDFPSLTVTAAKQIQGILDTEVVAVGVGVDAGNEQFSGELYAIATDPDSTHVYKTSDSSQESFESIFVPLVRELCDGEYIFPAVTCNPLTHNLFLLHTIR